LSVLEYDVMAEMLHTPTGNHADCSRRSLLRALATAGTATVAARIVGAGATLVGARTGLAAAPVATAPAPNALIQPSAIRSQGGVLKTVITAAAGPVELGEFTLPGLLYNGSYIPPVLRCRLGDTLRITLKNALPDQPTNLHFHGMSVSPEGNSDNVFIHVHPGEQFDYEVHVPATGRQGPGFFWFHPHAHGLVDKQVLGGMSGALVVDGFERLFPIVGDMPERFLLLKHAEAGEGNEVISINGQVQPVIDMRPGEAQFWRIGNIGAEMFFKLRIDGVRLYALATDGHPLSRPHPVGELFLGPGERIDLLALAPEPGVYGIHTVSFQNQAWKAPRPAEKLATISCQGPDQHRHGEADILRQRVQADRWIDTVRSSAIARRRTLVYSRNAARTVFMINGRVMDEHRVDEVARLGDTEEWTVINTDQQYHNFHIHQTPFLVTEINGVPRDEDSMHDTFSMLPATADRPSTLKVVIPFTDPVIVGKFVYHCHAADHEDKGMMGIIEVVA
jgi:FtsP/CotA-like multicopper oxidase with cupredoxin domain